MNVVIGGSSGIGAAVADRLPGETVRASRSAPVRCDVRDAASLAELAAGFDRIDALVVSAGVAPGTADARTVFDTALAGTTRALDAFDHLLVEGTVVVCVASIAGHLAQPGPAALQVLDRPLDIEALVGLTDDPDAAYLLAKHGVIRLVRSRAAGLGRRGVRIVSVSPGIVDTGFTTSEAAGSEVFGQLRDTIPLDRSATAAEVAEVVAFLCSPAASYVTGTDLIVDGGLTGAIGDHIRPSASPAAPPGRPSFVRRLRRKVRRLVR